jgi:hypothetical protein
VFIVLIFLTAFRHELPARSSAALTPLHSAAGQYIVGPGPEAPTSGQHHVPIARLTPDVPIARTTPHPLTAATFFRHNLPPASTAGTPGQ